jgi:hypothetical protein
MEGEDNVRSPLSPPIRVGTPLASLYSPGPLDVLLRSVRSAGAAYPPIVGSPLLTARLKTGGHGHRHGRHGRRNGHGRRRKSWQWKGGCSARAWPARAWQPPLDSRRGPAQKDVISVLLLVIIARRWSIVPALCYLVCPNRQYD